MLARKQSMMAAVAVAMVGFGAFAFQSTSAGSGGSAKTVVINVTTGPDEIMSVVTALHVAEDALDDGRHVVLFFNGRGVTVPVKRLHQDLSLGDERPLWVMLDELVGRGAEVLVARESARILNMADAEFMNGTQLGQWGGSVFCKMHGESVVFTY
ncbi:MAG: DsrE family protein [Phycisphaerales bacterium]|nr:DsrE family protein [Phycisphaerales bacterium]